MGQQEDLNQAGEEATAAHADLRAIVDAAARLGVEMDENEALQWLTAVAGDRTGEQVTFDSRTGVFGHRVTMLDFSPGDLERIPCHWADRGV